MLLIFMPYHGEVGIAPWEYLLSLVYAMLLYVSYARRKNLRLRSWPEYRYYIPGFGMKMLGGLAFTLIYFYYYPGGDTTAYFFSGVAMKQLLFQDPVEYLRQVVLGDNSERAIAAYAASSMPPYRYVFLDGHTFQAVRISSVLSLITFNSYLVSTLLLASLSFMGAWACYRTFVSYFPSLRGRLAIAFLFMPSVVFWGSGISKDTLTFSATCGWVHAVDEVFFKRRHPLRNWALMGFCGAVLVAVKPYIFMVLLPATMLWVFYMRVVRLRNALVRFVLIPLLALGLVAASVAALTRMENLLGKFALDEALQSMQTIQGDLAHNVSYGDNKFDVGPFDGTWWGVAKKFPVATTAALFRPYLWESGSVVILLSGLENLFVLGLTLWVLLRAGPGFSLRCIAGHSLLLMSVTFALLFAFAVGVSTANFGALVRFKIPMLPFYVSSLFIILHLHDQRVLARRQGRSFSLADHRMGPADVPTKAEARSVETGHPWVRA